MKKLICLLAFLTALMLFAYPAAADSANMERVIDQAGMLSQKTVTELTDEIRQIADQYRFDVVILNIDGIANYTTYDFAADYYDYGGYGYGENHDGIMLLIVTSTRDYFIMNTGSAEKIFSDSELTKIENEILPLLGKNNYDAAEKKFVEMVENRLEAATPEGRAGRLLPILTAVGAGSGAIATGAMRSGMKSVRKKKGAANYIKDGSFRLHTTQDIYLYTTTTRQRIQTQSGGSHSGGGGGFDGGFTGHSGTHHSGHGGKF